MKKTILMLLTLTLLLSIVLTVNAEPDSLLLQQVKVNMPQITVALQGSDFDAKEISATLGGEKLAFDGVETYDPAKHSTCVYVLLDVSISMRNSGQADLVKKNILEIFDSLGENDRLVLYTFGDTVDKLLNGEEDEETVQKIIEEIEFTHNNTLLYKALDEVYRDAINKSKNYTRTYAIAFSDGRDDQKGNVNYEEIKNKYINHSLPIYAMCVSNKGGADEEQFSAIARSSGGAYFNLKEGNSLENLQNCLNNVSILTFHAATNIADGNTKKLVVYVGQLSTEGHDIPILNSIPDTEAPKILNAEYDLNENRILLTFSETVRQQEPGHISFIINDENKKTIKPSDYLLDDNDQSSIELVLSEPLYNGSYTVEVSGIVDCSQEKNAVSNIGHFTVSGASDAPDEESTSLEEPEQNEGKNDQSNLWVLVAAIAAVLIVAIVVVVVILCTRRKTEQREENRNPQYDVYEHHADSDRARHHIIPSASMRLILQIRTGGVAEQRIETSISSSLIVGRSSICDLFIDDAKLSRQHFAIERSEGDLFVTDLNSKNGTFLNGIRVKSKQKLGSGDKITVGLSEIYVRMA